MPQATPIFLMLVMVSLAFLASQLLIYFLLYTNELLDELDIFKSLTVGFQRELKTCENGDCSHEGSPHCPSEATRVIPMTEDDNILYFTRKSKQIHHNISKQCSRGYFRLNQHCHPMLTCQDMDDIKVLHQIGAGAVKQVYLAKWREYEVTFSNLSQPAYKEDFLYGAKMLQQFHPSAFVVQLIGLCSSFPAIITEYHSLGSLDNIDRILRDKNEDNVMTRFRLCLDYVRIIDFLHSNPTGIYVMCDSNDLTKTLSQFLVTSDLRLVINDLDALPVVDSSNGHLIKCGHREIHGDFVAPEQLWPYPGETFNEEKMPGYDEKTDIWKIPTVVDYLLGDDVHADVIRFHLFKIHSRCRSREPELRPTAVHILNTYLETQSVLNL